MKTKNLVLYALLIALTCIGTMIIHIPVPATNGYVNIGDSMIIVSALAFGPWAGLLAGGLGSMLADVFGGYVHFALPTLIIKGAEGALIGYLFHHLGKNKTAGFIASLLGVLWMATGYFIVESFMYNSALVAFKSLFPNLMQAGASLMIGYPLYTYVLKSVGSHRFQGQ